MSRKLIAGLAAAALVACAPDTTAPSTSEVQLAADAALIAQNVGTTAGVTHDGWLRRLMDTLRTTDDPEARAFLEQARAYHDSARAAIEAGDREAARRYLHLAFWSFLSAVVEVFPNAPQRTGAVVDEIVTRIEERLGDREAPRIRAVLAHVGELRAEAEAALANGEPVRALAINLRALHILHRLVDHLRDGMDHDGEADRHMEGTMSRP
jgi:hypothetical protein